MVVSGTKGKRSGVGGKKAWITGWLAGWLSGWMDGWMDGWMSGRKDEKINGWKD